VIFLDTSALYALADRGDGNHRRAVGLFEAALGTGHTLLTHNYILVESMALLQHRLGLASALRLAEDAAAFEVEWISSVMHDKAVSWLRKSGRRQVSLVDAISFAVMQARGVVMAFAFDPHFTEQGFRLFEGT